MKKILLWLVIVATIVAISFVGTACTVDTSTAAETTASEATVENSEAAETTASEAVAEEKLVFGETNPMQDEWWISNVNGAKDYCAANGIELNVMNTAKPQDALEQINHIDEMITNEVDAILVIVSDGDLLADSVKKANAAGIPIGTSGAEINLPRFGENDVDVRIIGSNYEPAKKYALYIAELLGGKGDVVSMSGVPGIAVSDDRERGIQEGFKEGGLTLLDSQPAQWDPDKSYQLMSDYLTKFPKIDAVFGCYGGGTLAAYQAAKAVGREKEMLFFAWDGSKSVLEAMARGEIAGDVDMNPYNMGWLMASGLHRAAAYPKFQRSITQVEFRIITPDNLAKYYPELAQ